MACARESQNGPSAESGIVYDVISGIIDSIRIIKRKEGLCLCAAKGHQQLRRMRYLQSKL